MQLSVGVNPASIALARAQTLSTVKPYLRSTTAAGAEAPKRRSVPRLACRSAHRHIVTSPRPTHPVRPRAVPHSTCKCTPRYPKHLGRKMVSKEKWCQVQNAEYLIVIRTKVRYQEASHPTHKSPHNHALNHNSTTTPSAPALAKSLSQPLVDHQM